MSEPGGRVYGGRSEAERRADRRARLVRAGFELFGSEGWHAVTIERLCGQASVATRSFYEEFPSREALLQAVYDGLVREALAAVQRAVADRDAPLADRIAAGMRAYVDHIAEDPRRARIGYREVRAVGLEQHRHDAMLECAEAIAPDLTEQVLSVDPVRRRVLTLALAGALSEVFVDWVASPEPRPALAPVREELSRLFTAALCAPASSGWTPPGAP